MQHNLKAMRATLIAAQLGVLPDDLAGQSFET